MRYAVYYAPPPDHPLWLAGCNWLGRDPTIRDMASGIGPSNADLRDPWRYGFHATFKPPMSLRANHSERDFLDAIERLARRTAAFALPPLVAAALSDFLVLRPATPVRPDHPLRRLADACVSQLDPFRAPPTLMERAKRLSKLGRPLGDEQRTLLERWGYPHVFHRWRFHLTLTNSLPRARRQALLAAARAHFAAALLHPAPVQDLAVYVEPAPGAPFLLTERFALQGLNSGFSRPSEPGMLPCRL